MIPARLQRLSTKAVCLFALALLLFGLRCRPAEQALPHTSTLPGLEDSPFPYAAPEEVGLDHRKLRTLMDSVGHWAADGDIVGAEVMLVSKGRIVLHETVGWSDREEKRPLERNSIFNMRSMSKPFLGASILMLREEGKLSIDDPVARYLPAFDNERSKEITIRHLLTHTAGYTAEGFARPRKTYSTLRAVVDDVGLQGPQFPPGERYRYSDVSSSVLGAIISEVSGMPVARFIEQRILAPLHLSDTHTEFRNDAPWAGRVNSHYTWSAEEGDFKKFWDFRQAPLWTYYRASAGLYSTVFDYALFLDCWMRKGERQGVRLLSAGSVEEALRPYAGDRYGFQWFVAPGPIADGMPLHFGHFGSDGALAIAFPEPEVMLFYFTQSRNHHRIGRFIEVFNELEILSSPIDLQF